MNGINGDFQSMIRQLPSLLKTAATGWMNDNASRLSASLSYYAIFSIAPLLVIVLSLLGFVFGKEAAQGQIARQLSGLVGTAPAETIQAAVAATSKATTAGVWATTLGIILLLVGATTVFAELKNSFDQIWGVKEKPGRAVMNLIGARLLSISFILCIGFLLLISLVISALLAGLSQYMEGIFHLPTFVWTGADLIISLSLMTVMFALMFRLLTNAEMDWKEAGAGGLLTAILFTAGKTGIAWYVGRTGVGSSFGAAGSVVVILLWIYYTTCILFFGAEFTKAYTKSREGKIMPDKHGRKVKKRPAA